MFEVDKIKTLGDSYMAVAGLIESTPDHAEHAVRMALGTIEEIGHSNAENKCDFSARIGINSGAVIGGVIGESRFMYDMWGVTVNVASRMESEGINGKVQVSEASYDLVKLIANLKCTSRGEVEIKGKGTMNTWLVENASA